LYNRYISGRSGDEDFVPASSLQFDFQQPVSLPQSKPAPAEDHSDGTEPAAPASSQKSLFGSLFGKRGSGFLDNIFGGFKNLDLGDIILILILILLVLENDDSDFLIVLALVFFLGI